MARLKSMLSAFSGVPLTGVDECRASGNASAPQVDNSLGESIVVALSRTHDFFFLEGSPTEPDGFSV